MTGDVCNELYADKVSYVPIQIHSSYARLIYKTRLILTVLRVTRSPVTLSVVISSMMYAGTWVGTRVTPKIGRLVPVTVALVRCS